MKHLIDWSPMGLLLLGALAIGNALLKVGAIPASAWEDNPLLACCGPEPGCPSPFPGICEDS